MARVKRFFLLIAAAALGLLFCCTAEADEKRDYYILIPENAKATESYAAQVLSEYLYVLSDERPPIIKEGRSFDGYGFYIGDTSVVDTSDIAGETDGSYNLVPLDNGSGLAIYGSGTRGTLYGVFGFLEDYCGYRCFTAETGMQSVTGKITFPKKKVEFHCSFEYTDTDWKSPSDEMYSLANGLNGDPHRTLAKEQGGDIDYLGGFCHTLTTNFCAASKYFKSHPEYFALHDGKRVPDQLCLTNSGTYNTVLSEVKAILREYHDPNAALQIISLTQNDNLNYCECDNCRKLDNANGSQAGTIITFANRIANAVKEEKPEYKNVAIDCFAYQYSRKAPSQVVPEDNVIVRFCTIESCFSHPLNDAGCPKNAQMLEDIKAWNKICDRLYVWDYTTNYGYPIGIFPDFDVLQDNMQFFAENGIKGVYEEGNYFLSECDSEFGELRSYLISRLLRNPYCDYDREMELFCNAYYGKGGTYIKDFINSITECSKQKHVTIYSPMSESFNINEVKAEEFDNYWTNAIAASSGNKSALAAIERSMLSWRYVKACLGLREFKGSLEDSLEARKLLHQDLISHGIEKIDEWNEIKEDFTSYSLIPVEEWPYADIIHILKYDANGGSGAPLSQWSNGYIEISSTVPTRNGFTFLGWSSDSSAKTAEYRPEQYFTLQNDMTLYAVWDGEEIPGSGESGEGGTPAAPTDPDTGDEDDGYDDEQEFIIYSISVAGNDIDSTIARDLSVIKGVTLKDGGYARYNPEKRTLYLKDADIDTPDDAISDSYGLWAVFNDDIPLTISVKGHCSITGESAGQDFPMSLAVWGNLTIRLNEGAVLDVEATTAPEATDNAALYIGNSGELVIDGPGTVNFTGVNAIVSHGISYACFLSGNVSFEGGCTVNARGGAQAASGKGFCIGGSQLVFKDDSTVHFQGGDAGQSYGMQFMNEGNHEFITDNWTGSLIIEGNTSAILGNTQTLTRSLKDTFLFGSENISANNMSLLKSASYTCSKLSRYRKLYLMDLTVRED